jgi:arylsulfatase A-like enzyme
VDVVPTLLALAGLEVPSEMQGENLYDWCRFGKGKRREAVYFSAANWRAVWDGRFMYAPHGNKNVLYDHLNDPYEMANLLTDPGYASERTRLCEMLVGFAEEFEDPELSEIRNTCGM